MGLQTSTEEPLLSVPQPMWDTIDSPAFIGSVRQCLEVASEVGVSNFLSDSISALTSSLQASASGSFSTRVLRHGLCLHLLEGYQVWDLLLSHGHSATNCSGALENRAVTSQLLCSTCKRAREVGGDCTDPKSLPHSPAV